MSVNKCVWGFWNIRPEETKYKTVHRLTDLGMPTYCKELNIMSESLGPAPVSLLGCFLETNR